MSSGRDSPPTPRPLPTPPTMDEINSILNRATGLTTIKVKKPDGAYGIVTERLPQTEEETQISKKLGEVLKKSFLQIESLIDTDPGSLADYAPFINTLNNVSQERANDMSVLTNIPNFKEFSEQFERRGSEILEKEFAKRRNEQDAFLANRGLNQSSQGIAMRNSLASEKAEAMMRNKETASARAYDERAKFLQDSSNVYQARELERVGRLQNSEAIANLQNKEIQEQNANRQRQLQNQGDLFNTVDTYLYRDKKDSQIFGANAEQQMLGNNNQTNTNRLQRYQVESGNILAENAQDLERFKARDVSPGFGQMAMGLVGQVAGGTLGSMGSSFGSTLGKGLGNNVLKNWGNQVKQESGGGQWQKVML